MKMKKLAKAFLLALLTIAVTAGLILGAIHLCNVDEKWQLAIVAAILVFGITAAYYDGL